MNEFNHLSEQLARDTVTERVQTAQRARLAGPPTRRTRRGLAAGLHRLADRLDIRPPGGGQGAGVRT